MSGQARLNHTLRLALGIEQRRLCDKAIAIWVIWAIAHRLSFDLQARCMLGKDQRSYRCRHTQPAFS